MPYSERRGIAVLLLAVLAVGLCVLGLKVFGSGSAEYSSADCPSSQAPVGADRDSQLAASPVVLNMALGTPYDQAVKEWGDMADYPKTEAEARRLMKRVVVHDNGRGMRCTDLPR
ncbi:hypothetical protein [Luteipulveratus flavus]|uniref:Uncharacterized protein n=1 Tax=Luteipulveratus flavus TaxID=3031728 RepID=A0ABT6C3X2_9MICO|nr:hypothetical protein [Luteipulveratus sp. YIM 133296]MDF8263498.1 hypothetical protein [Luteipulveratus sp. YIM 133296]